jgi:hypothetical protein
MPRGGSRPGAGRKPKNAPAITNSANSAGEKPAKARVGTSSAPEPNATITLPQPAGNLSGWDLIEYLFRYIDGKDPQALHLLAAQHGEPTDSDSGMVKLQRIRTFFEKAVRGIS